MIRLFCATCNSALRVPEDLAGRRGKCAQCGAINEIPSPVAVEVKRAPEPSPFRSTADVAARAAIEGTLQVPGAEFLATAPTAAAITADSEEFDLILPCIADDIAKPVALEEPPPPPEESPASPDRQALSTPDIQPASAPPMINVRPAGFRDSTDARSAIRTALIVGMVLGFLLGVLAARCLG